MALYRLLRGQLARFKTGAARIALGTRERHPDVAVSLVPCGLTYMTPQRFRSSVLVQFGPALELAAPPDAAFCVDPHAAARELTERMEASLRALTVNAEDWETLRVLDGVRRLYQPPRIRLDERVELARRFATHYPSLRHEPEVEQLYGRVAGYLDRLASLGLSDHDLARDLRPGESLRLLLRHLVLVLVWLPAALAVERLGALRRLATTSLRLLFLRREVAALRRERAALVDDVVDTVQRFKPEGLELLFPRVAPLASAE